MVDIKYEKMLNGKILIKIRDLRTECPFSSKKDISNIAITLKKPSLDPEEFVKSLSYYINKNIKGKEIEMEVIPIITLYGCIVNCIKLKMNEEKRYAAPEEVEVECVSRKEDGSWVVSTKVKFKRKVLDRLEVARL